MSNHATNAYAARMAAQALTPAEFKVEPRVYYHTHNYARFHIDLGPGRTKTVTFANYRHITDDKREQDQLDLVADQPGTFIYTIPDSDVARAMQEELAREQQQDVLKTAQAAAAVSGQQFDARTPIVPVVHNMAGPQGVAVVGMQNSLSGSIATPGLVTAPEQQVAAPNAQTAALDRLNAMTADAKASK